MTVFLGLSVDDLKAHPQSHLLHKVKPGDITTFLKQAQWLKREIFDVTNTPAQDDAAADASGESLKQREIKLLGKVQRFQVKIGNAWEDVLALAHRVARANGLTPPAYTRFQTRWKNAEIRDDAAVIDNALKVRAVVGDEEFLNLIAPVFGYDAEKVKVLLKAVVQQREQAMRDAMNAFNRSRDTDERSNNTAPDRNGAGTSTLPARVMNS